MLNNNRNEILLILIFVVVNVTIYFFSIDFAPLASGADAGQYLHPAISLVDYGNFTMNPPGRVPETGVESSQFTFGTPLYSILLAFHIFFFGQGEAFYATIVATQCSLLYLTGYISRSFLPFFNSKHVILIHALVIFNPNSLITAHLIQSETLFTLFLVIILLYIFQYIKYGLKRSLVLIGVFSGLLTLTRPAGLYLVYAIPVILIVAELFLLFYDKSKCKRSITTSMSNVFIPVLISILVISPWYIRNYVNNNQFFLTASSGAYLKDNYVFLLSRGGERAGITEQKATEIADNKMLEYFGENGINSKCLHDDREPYCYSYVADSVLVGILDEPIKAHIKALIQSWGNLYFSGGASNFRNYIGLEGRSLVVSYDREDFHGFDSIIKLIKKMDVGYFLIFSIFTSFAIVTRFIGFVGLYKTIKNPETVTYLIIIVAILVIFTAMYLYLGQSRFRVPLEPILMLLTVLAFSRKEK